MAMHVHHNTPTCNNPREKRIMQRGKDEGAQGTKRARMPKDQNIEALTHDGSSSRCDGLVWAAFSVVSGRRQLG